jgi:hypothetical protein
MMMALPVAGDDNNDEAATAAAAVADRAGQQEEAAPAAPSAAAAADASGVQRQGCRRPNEVWSWSDACCQASCTNPNNICNKVRSSSSSFLLSIPKLCPEV